MSSLLRDLGTGFWRLVPANPILVRVVFAGGRRLRHLWIRTGYLAVLTAAVVVGVLLVQTPGRASLTSLAKSASRLFDLVSVVQLGMVCLLAPIFAAGAITQERDSQTFSILLSTPLSNAQIVLGSLLSRLYFVVVLLVAGLPLFCIMMVYGGITGREILLSFGLAAASAALTASMAIALSVIKIGTGRTIFSFYLAIALYLMAIWALAQSPLFIPAESQPAPGRFERMSWLAALHPFLSLWVVLNKTPAPEAASVSHHGFPKAYLLAYPAQVYILWCLAASALLVGASILFVRRGAKLGEPTWWGRLFKRSGPSVESGGLSRVPRYVWANPVAWREAKTKAAAGTGGLLRIGLFAIGLSAGIVLLAYYARGLEAGSVRMWLKGVVGVELGLALFIATATAATSMTREKEANTLELLLVTPLESRHIVRGKTWGLISFAAPMLAVPFATMVLFVLYDLLSGRLWSASGPIVYPEGLFSLPLVMVACTSLACMIGLKTSIQQRRTMMAVLISMAWVVGILGMPGLCAFGSVGTSAGLASAGSALCPLTAILMAIDPRDFLSQGLAQPSVGVIRQCRWIATLGALAAAILYGAGGWWVYKQMVRTFDMVIRKQSV